MGFSWEHMAKTPLMALSAVRAVNTFLPIQNHLPLSVTSPALGPWPRGPDGIICQGKAGDSGACC